MGRMGTALRREEEQRICLHGLLAATETQQISLVELCDWLLGQNERERARLLARQAELRRAGASVAQICRQMIADSQAREHALRPRRNGKPPAAGDKQPGQIALE